MTERVMALSGKAVTVPGMGDMGGDGSVQIATSSRLGIVKCGGDVSVDEEGELSVGFANTERAGIVQIGENIDVTEEGEIRVHQASLEQPGVVKMAVIVPFDGGSPVTTFPEAQAAYDEVSTTLSQLIQSLQQAGIMSK